jgi:hypothetical protein
VHKGLGLILSTIMTAVGADTPWSKTIQARMENALPPPLGTPASRKWPKSSAAFAFYGQVTVEWASAPLVLEASHESLPPEFGSHYAIRVRGLPREVLAMATPGSDGIINSDGVVKLLIGATLSVRHLRTLQSYYVTAQPDNKSMLFAFRRSAFPIAADVVTFRLKIGDMTLEAKFDPKTMTYKGALAL